MYLKLNIQKTKIMASSPITSWEIDGETVETVSDLFFFPIKFKIAVIFLKYLLTYINFAKKVIYKKSADFILILLLVVRKQFFHMLPF